MSPSSPKSTARVGEIATDESVGYLLARVRSQMASEVQQLTMPHCQLACSQANLLLLIRRGVNNGADLARETGTDASAVTRMLDKLEERQLLTRTRSETDRRVVFVELTSAGQSAVAKLKPLYTEVMERMLAGIADEDVDILRSLLIKIISNYETRSGK